MMWFREIISEKPNGLTIKGDKFHEQKKLELRNPIFKKKPKSK